MTLWKLLPLEWQKWWLDSVQDFEEFDDVGLFQPYSYFLEATKEYTRVLNAIDNLRWVELQNAIDKLCSFHMCVALGVVQNFSIKQIICHLMPYLLQNLNRFDLIKRQCALLMKCNFLMQYGQIIWITTSIHLALPSFFANHVLHLLKDMVQQFCAVIFTKKINKIVLAYTL